MEFEELIEKYYYNEDDKINTEIPEEEKLKNILYDRFINTDRNFYDNCKDLIITSSHQNRYNGFTSGFKAGFEFAKSLKNFLDKP